MERRKFVIGMGALATGSAAAVGTGAFTAAELDGRDADIMIVDDTDGLIGLEAGGSELVNDEGGAGNNQLAIDFNVEDDGSAVGGDGVNPNSTYQVGGLAEIAGNIENVPGSPAKDTSAADVAVDTDTNIGDECAFKLMNQSGSDQTVELTYEANEHFPEDALIYMVSYWADGTSRAKEQSALSAAVTGDDRAASILYSDTVDYSAALTPGAEVKVTIIVDVGDVDMEDTDLGGELIVRAGSPDNSEFL